MPASPLNSPLDSPFNSPHPKENIMPIDKFTRADVPQPTQPIEEMHLAADMFHAVGLAAAAGIGTALASGFVVVMLALNAA
jgi:hypothetical protein